IKCFTVIGLNDHRKARPRVCLASYIARSYSLCQPQSSAVTRPNLSLVILKPSRGSRVRPRRAICSPQRSLYLISQRSKIPCSVFIHERWISLSNYPPSGWPAAACPSHWHDRLNVCYLISSAHKNSELPARGLLQP